MTTLERDDGRRISEVLNEIRQIRDRANHEWQQSSIATGNMNRRHQQSPGFEEIRAMHRDPISIHRDLWTEAQNTTHSFNYQNVSNLIINNDL